uniref:3-hydroxyisobutyrate dehydrogenase, mitochondrial n=1 Tax=Microcebus murinus TaxID=30608 RepID=A0A8C5W024_MICMU
MLPTSINAIEKDSLLIDSGTIDPAVSKELAKEVEKMGAVFMDAPVSGGVGAARLGNLTFMVGGVEDAFAAAQELLGCMGSSLVYCGAVGTERAAKTCNNMLLAISMIGTAEAMNLGIGLGLDPKLLAKNLNMSSGRCWSSATYKPVPGVMEGVPSANDYQGGFGTTLMAKDLGLAQDSATSTKSPILLGSLAHQLYRMMCPKGYSKKDFSSVFQFLRE